VHRVHWSGAYPENSLAGLRECYEARVARAEIDFISWRDELVVGHDPPRGRAQPALLRDFLEVVRQAPPGPTLLMLDAKDHAPWPRRTIERLAQLIGPVRERVFVGTPADWNLTRLRAVDPDVAVAFDPQYYLDRLQRRERMSPPKGAYGYHDAHPLARRRTVPAADYLRERLEQLCRVVPGTREVHLRLSLVERMLDEGLDVAGMVHVVGARLDVWTLNAGTRRWRQRFARIIEAGADIVTSDTPRELAAAARS
jgi:glycerophosphoryl diester phosphodiesterase